eukprot:11871665-Ditylum_brightwellii.AAC.1
MGYVIGNITDMNTVNPPLGDNDLHIVSLLLVIPMLYNHGSTTGTINMNQLEQMEAYYWLMGL